MVTVALRDQVFLTFLWERRCAAHIGMGGVKIKKEPRQWDEYVYRIS